MMGKKLSKKPNGFKSGPKKEKKEAIMFDVKKRFEFLNGFSKRKQERKTRGNLINMKKELKRKRDELSTYKKHVQQEYQKAVEAVRHNYGESGQVEEPESTNVIEEETHFFPGEETDPFGEVSIHVTSLESPEFSTVSRLLTPGKAESANEPPVPAKTNPESSKKKLPIFAKFKRMAKSSKFLQQKKRKDKQSKGNKRVKSTVKKTKKKH